MRALEEGFDSLESKKLWDESNKLWRNSAKLWAEAARTAYGDIRIEWDWSTGHGRCTLENGDVYDADQSVELTPA